MSSTPNISLERPERGAPDWDTSLNLNMTKLDAIVGNNSSSILDLPQIYIETGTFNFTTGDTITLPSAVDNVNEYAVKVTPTTRAGAIGDIYVTKTTTNFVVKCSENNTADTFEAVIHYIGDVASYGGTVYRKWYVSPDASITDHAVAATVGSLAYVIAQIVAGGGTAVVELPGNKTYVQTSLDITAPVGVFFIFQPGALVQPASGKTFTIYSPQHILSSTNQQIIDTSNNEADPLEFTSGGIVYPQWIGGPTVNGGSDDATIPIRVCLSSLYTNDCKGVVRLRSGVYKVYPQSAGTSDNVLTIDGSDITIQGDGLGSTKLDFYALSGADPEANWENIGGLTWRGHGIFITGGAAAGTTRRNVFIRDLEMDGNCDYTGDDTFPAPVGTGDGWDITHKGINIEADLYHDNINVERVWIHGFKGEIIYGGGLYTGRVITRGCILHETNGAIFSVSAENIIIGNELHTTASHGIENNYLDTHTMNIIRDNYIHDCDGDGIAASAVGSGPYGHQIVKNNILKNISHNGIFSGHPAVGAKNVYIEYNILIDTGIDTNYRGISLSWRDTTGRIENCHVRHNLIIANEQNTYEPIIIDAGSTNEAQGLIVEFNNMLLTKYGDDNSKAINSGVVLNGDYGINCLIGNNTCEGSTYEFTGERTAIEELLTTTGATIIARQRPYRNGFFQVDVAYRVITAATDVTINVAWYDDAGNSLNEDVVSEVAKAVGSYVVASKVVMAGGDSESEYVKVTATAGTANQVYVSANIGEAGLRGQDTN